MPVVAWSRHPLPHPHLQPVGEEAAADIDKDLGRTFPTLKRFAAAEGQEALRRVLRAYAALDPEVRAPVWHRPSPALWCGPRGYMAVVTARLMGQNQQPCFSTA